MKAMDGEVPDSEKPMPDVPPPDFINACKAVLLNFGNLQYDDERGDLATRIKQIASEAEVVATRIYGQGMTTTNNKTVLGKSKQLPSSTWNGWSLKLKPMESMHLGQILTKMKTCCFQDLTVKERCRLVVTDYDLQIYPLQLPASFHRSRS